MYNVAFHNRLDASFDEKIVCTGSRTPSSYANLKRRITHRLKNNFPSLINRTDIVVRAMLRLEGETSFLPFKDEIFRRDIAGKRINFGVVVRIEKKPEREFYPSLLLNGAFD